MWLQTGESSERAAFADISLKEQGEIRALQEEEEEEEEGGGGGEGGCANSARPSASLSCQVDGRPPEI